MPVFIRASAEERDWLITNFPGSEVIKGGLTNVSVPDSETALDFLFNCLRGSESSRERSFYRTLHLKMATAKSIEMSHEPMELWEFVPTTEEVMMSPHFCPDPWAFHEEEEL